MNKELEKKVMQSKKVLKHAIDKWKPAIGISFSGGKDSTCILGLIREIYVRVPIPLLFTDTGVKFKETYQFIKKLKKDWNLLIYKTKPLKKYQDVKGKRERCCYWLKIEPPKREMDQLGWQAVIVGIRHDEHKARSEEKFIVKKDGRWRIHPLIFWTEKDVWEYLRDRKIPTNPLYKKGFRSIGCEPCTVPAKKSAKERAGRDQDKEIIMRRLRNIGYW